MLKKSLYISLFLIPLSHTVHATNHFKSPDELFIFCQNQTNYPKVNININPVIYNQSLSSSEIKQISHAPMKSKELGLFRSENKIMVDMSYAIEFFIDNYKQVHTCSYATKINLNIELISTIYIAKEILPFPCTKNRTIIHENQHFKFQTDTLTQNKNIIENQSKVSLANPGKQIFKFEFDSQYIKDWYANYYQLKQNELNQFIDKQVLSKAKNLHYHIDTEENYIREKNLCHANENNQLDNILFK